VLRYEQTGLYDRLAACRDGRRRERRAAPRERLGSPRRRLATLALASSVVVAFLAAANATTR
jgi:hypothetical protein